MSELNPQLVKARTRADSMNISYHHRANAATIVHLIEAHLEANPEVPVPDDVAEFDISTLPKPNPLTEAEWNKLKLGETKRTVGSLRRVMIQCMDPAKREWPGEIISVGSAKLGTFKKFIPFNQKPYHIPQIIYDFLKERKCTIFNTEMAGPGMRQKVRKAAQINAFNIVDLPPLTEDELEELRKQQELANAGL